MKPAVLALAGLALGPLLVHAPVAEAETIRISVPSTGGNAGLGSQRPAISADGRFVVFEAFSSLVPGTEPDWPDPYIYVYDRLAGGLSGIGLGEQPTISADGRFVAYVGVDGGILHDRLSGEVSYVVGGGVSPMGLSADARYVAFVDERKVYVHDRIDEVTELVAGDPSRPLSATEGAVYFRPAISADGRYVAFTSYAADIAPDDTNGSTDVFVHDRLAGTTTLISRGADGSVGDDHSRQPVMSADGRFVAYVSHATNLDPRDEDGDEDVYLHDRATGETTFVSVDPAPEAYLHHNVEPAISGDGRFVAYLSQYRVAVPDRPSLSGMRMLRYDRLSGETQTVSVRDDGGEPEAEGWWGHVALDFDGAWVAYGWPAPMVPEDTNGIDDVFLRRMGPPGTAPVGVLAAVAPGSRAGRVGETTTAFGVLLNESDEVASGCRVQPPLGAPVRFSFQTTDPATNLLTGEPDAPVDVPAGASQTFLLAFAPEAVVPPQHLGFGFECDNALPASTRPWVNTLLYSAGTTPVPDPIAIYATLEGDGTVRVSSSPSQPAFFTVAGVNIGSEGTLNAVPVADDSLPVDLLICETDPGTGACEAPPGPTAGAVFPRDTIRTFTVFVFGKNEPIPTDYIHGRARLEFRSTAGEVLGATSVVVLPEAEG